ncbi:hypothetical protein HPG69_002421 [Diceros bicornis minor]|uniref:Immunoglobulin domain-containing protein n=1 Tax=Diceros bicornis minor TaxID=77932 RepID=A0A7J7FPA6_DICBM|nr:hypothetical protein HPG69_002421 [Diceros bicornis minor]
MAWEATYLLPPVLLVLLASGSWEQKPEMLHKLEGEMMSVRCPYQPWQGLNKMKIWCRKISVYSCDETVTNFQKVPRHSIQDYPGSGYFIVTKTELRVEDSGTYWCGISKSSRILLLRAIHLVVSKVSTLSPARSTRKTTAWTSAIIPVIDSPAGHWDVISGVVVAVVLLLVLILLLILYLRKARERAKKDEGESHHDYETVSAREEEHSVPGKDCSPRQRESQLSWGSKQQTGSGEDTGTICYASLNHLNHFGPEDSIYINTHPNPKPTSDPLLAVEYASIAGNRLQPSKSAALEGEPRI